MNEEEIKPVIDNAEVLDTSQAKVMELDSVENVMERSYLRYSMSVIIARALPDVRDGLKPVHRRILYVMGQNNLTHTAKYRKSATVVGDVMGNYHPHGDAAIYDSMVRLAQSWSMRYKLVDGQGNFGSLDGDPAAAYRYTEARMDRHAEEMLADIDKETVPFRDNYDGSKQEPSVLPAKLPNLLLNGQMGIAVGMATNIPPHNLSEVVDAIIHMIDHPDKVSTEYLLKFIKGPDFPTGGIVYAGDSLKQAYTTGRGGVTMRAIAEIEETNKGRHQIIVSEIPYAVNKATLVERIADLVKDKKIVGISDLRDESARGVIRIVIELKRDSYPKKVLNQLYKLTPLQSSFNYNMLALIDGIQPRVLGLEEILHEYLKHRQIVVRRRTEFELRKAKERAHILEGLVIALDHIDEVIKVIRESNTTEDAQIALMKRFGLSQLQAEAILSMQLRRLAGLERKKIEDELKQLKELIAKLETILADEQKILELVKSELLEAKKNYGDERKTRIINQDLGKFSDEELIPDEQVVVAITTENYIKRTLVSEYRRQSRGGKGKRGMTTKEEDVIDQLVTASTHDWLLLFTNKGRVFRLKAYEVPAASLTSKGVAVVNLVQLQPEEQVTSMICVNKDTDDKSHYLFMTTIQGVVKKTPLSDYNNIRMSGLIAIKLDDADELRWIHLTSGSDDVLISTSTGQAIRFSEKDARPMGRSARGVRGIRLRKGDIVVGVDIAQEDHNLLVMSQNGYGKLTKVANFPGHKRGGVGIKAAIVNSKTGTIVAVRSFSSNTGEVLMISTRGQTIRIGLRDIPLLGRTTQGVRVMRLNEGDKVASLGLVAEGPDEDSGSEENVES